MGQNPGRLEAGSMRIGMVYCPEGVCKLSTLAAVRQGRGHRVWSGLGGRPFGEDRKAKST